MVLLLQRVSRFEAVEQRFSADLVAEVREQVVDHDVALTLPRFTVETSLDLKQLLVVMGMPMPFSGAADFTGIIADGGLVVSDAQHRATMTVDEQGTEATTATGIAVAESAYAVAELTVDRPFFVAIIERDESTILFLGRVVAPGAS